MDGHFHRKYEDKYNDHRKKFTDEADDNYNNRRWVGKNKRFGHGNTGYRDYNNSEGTSRNFYNQRGHRGRGNRREYFNNDFANERQKEERSSNSGGNLRHPPGLKGREIGMWYANRSRGAAKVMHKAPQLTMDTDEAHALNRALDGLMSPNKNNESKIKPLKFCTGDNFGADCDAHIDGLDTKHFDSFDQPEKFMGQNSKKQKKNYNVLERLNKIEDSDFKKAYKANIEGNQRQNDIVKPEPSLSALMRDSTLDQQLYDDLIANEASNKYQKMLEFRKQLPSYKMTNDILKAIHDNQVIVISGETGCGKTTQVAQFILDDSIKNKTGSTCNIICTQPRRISAISVSQRVADERAETLGNSVGYQIRLEKVSPRPKGSVLYCTTGIILQYLISDPLLSTTSHLILDEIHERDTLSDFLICLSRDLLPKRKDLKLVLMSATLNAQLFSDYFGGAPMIHIPGFTYDVKEYYLEDVVEFTRFRFEEKNKKIGHKRYFKKFKEKEAEALDEFTKYIAPYLRNLEDTNKYSLDTINELYKPECEEINLELMLQLLHYICQQPPGAVLIFLPGWDSISKLSKMIEEEPSLRSSKLRVVPLHSLIPTVNQRQVFDRPPLGIRKVVIATNIAETSITIDDIVYVINCGKIKMTNFDKDLNISTLLPEWCTLANSKQRRGRAGRVQEGICYHLYTRAREMTFKPFPLPEIQRTRLEEVILQVKILKLGLCKSFLSRIMEPPEDEVVDMSIKMLQAINALDENENLTPLGFHLAKLPMDPLTGKMLLMGAIFSCLNPILTVAASLSFKDPFVISLGNEEMVDRRRVQLSRDTKSDHLMLAYVYDGWEKAKKHGHERNYLRENFLSASILGQLRNMRKQFVDLLYENKFIDFRYPDAIELNHNSDNLSVVKAVITAGLYPNVTRILKRPHGRKKGGTKSIVLPDRQKVAIHLKSVNSDRQRFENNWLIYWEKIKSTKIFLYDTTMISNYPLLLFGEKLNYESEENVINVDGFVKVSCSKEIFDVIQKLRTQLDELLEYKISHPGMTHWGSNTKEGKFLSLVVQTLESEKNDSIEDCERFYNHMDYENDFR